MKLSRKAVMVGWMCLVASIAILILVNMSRAAGTIALGLDTHDKTKFNLTVRHSKATVYADEGIVYFTAWDYRGGTWVRTHPDPNQAWSDTSQSVYPGVPYVLDEPSVTFRVLIVWSGATATRVLIDARR